MDSSYSYISFSWVLLKRGMKNGTENGKLFTVLDKSVKHARNDEVYVDYLTLYLKLMYIIYRYHVCSV